MTDHLSGRRVLLAGATGLVGREIMALLDADPAVREVIALVRRPLLPAQAGTKVRAEVVDFDRLDTYADLFHVDQVFCALGTTIRAAGSEAAFRRVDLEYPARLATLGSAGGAAHFLLVSALGADAASRVFYNRVKGEVEEIVTGIGYRSVTIARPSLLAGDRDEFRLGEVIANTLSWLIPPRWKPVHARQVARALVNASQQDAPGTHLLENRQLRAVTP